MRIDRRKFLTIDWKGALTFFMAYNTLLSGVMFYWALVIIWNG